MHAEIGTRQPGDGELLKQCLAALDCAKSVDEVIAALRTSARRLAGADGIAVVLREGDRCHYVEEDAIGPLWKGQRFPAESCVSGWAMNHRETVVIPDILLDPRVPQEAYRATFVRSMAMVPIGDPAPIGAIGAYWATAHGPTRRDVDRLERVARAAADALRGLAGTAPSTPRSRSGWFQRLDARDFLLWLPDKGMPFWWGQVLAVGSVSLSALVRTALTPLIGDTLVFAAFLPAIFVSALLGGTWSAVTAVVFGTAAAAAIDVSLGGAVGPARIAAWIFFALTAGFGAVIAAVARSSLDRQRARNSALERRDGQLAAMLREIDHRSRNTLAVAAALTRQAGRVAQSPEEMSDTLVRQFSAMAAAQGLTLEHGSQAVPLAELLQRCLEPFLAEHPIRIAVGGTLRAPGGAETMLALAMYELATNALKHGALSEPGGEVVVSGDVEGDEAVLAWTESGGPRVNAPERRGSGTRLIERALGAVGGRTELSYLPAGLVCRFRWGTAATDRAAERTYRQASR